MPIMLEAKSVRIRQHPSLAGSCLSRLQRNWGYETVCRSSASVRIRYTRRVYSGVDHSVRISGIPHPLVTAAETMYLHSDNTRAEYYGTTNKHRSKKQDAETLGYYV